MKNKIVVIDDSPDDQRIISRILAEFEIIFFDELESFFHLELTEIDLVIIDYNLPLNKGLAASHHLVSNQVPFIIMSGLLTLPLAIECMSEGACYCIDKADLLDKPKKIKEQINKFIKKKHELFEKELPFQSAFDNCPISVCVTDCKLTIVYKNQAFVNLLGEQRQSILQISTEKYDIQSIDVLKYGNLVYIIHYIKERQWL